MGSFERTRQDFTADPSGTVKKTAAGLAEKASDKVDNLVDSASDVIDGAMKKGRAVEQKLEETADQVKGAVDKSIVERPMATLAVAAAVGFVLGALWKT